MIPPPPNRLTEGIHDKSGGGNKYLWVITAMFLSYSIPAKGVVVETGVLHQCYPFLPARGHIGAIVLIQILPKEGCVRTRGAIRWFKTSMHRCSGLVVH